MSHLALVGPTAAGKSALALAMARSRPGVEIVSVDSMQVYRGIDIGTAKATAAERAEVPHHMIDVADPTERYSVARFAASAAAVLADIEARGATALLVGGTGLYLQAAIGDLEPPGDWPELREEFLAVSPAELHRRLTELDPLAAGRIEPGNTRRLARALEVTVGSGRPFSSYGPGIGTYPALTRFRLVGVWLPRAVLRARIAERVSVMRAQGLVDEVRGLDLGPTARQALGYKEILGHLEGGMALDDCFDEVVRRTKEFARRQRTWLRRDPRIRWHGTASDPAALLPGLLEELGS